MKKAIFALVVIAIFFPGRVRAQQPTPAVRMRHWYFVPPRELKHTAVDVFHFRNLDHGAFEWGYVGAYTADIVTTTQALDRYPKAREEGGPLFHFCRGSRDIGCIAGSYGAVMVGSLVLSHILLAHGKPHWYKDVIAGAVLGAGVGGHARAAYHNSQL